MSFLDKLQGLLGKQSLDVLARYELLREAVSGTMSKFYMARDRTTDQIVWTHTQRINGQHNAYMIPDDRPGGGNILLFDNGWSGQWAWTYNRVYSEVLEIDPVDHTLPYIYNARDSELPDWSFFSWFIAGAERMPNGTRRRPARATCVPTTPQTTSTSTDTATRP